MSLGLLDLDSVRFRLDGALSDVSRGRFEGGKWSQRFRDEPGSEWVGQIPPDIVVREHLGRGEVVVYGSPHKSVLGESVGPFGPAEFSEWVDTFAERLGLPSAIVRGAQVSRFDVAVNLDVSAAPSEYIAITEPPERMYSVGSRATTKTFKNGHGFAEITLYDKVQKIADGRRLHAVPASWSNRNVLRVEARFKKPKREFGRVVTVGMLCDPEFWSEVAGRYIDRVLAVTIRRGRREVPTAKDVADLLHVYAALGVESSGGVDLAIDRIDRAVRQALLKPRQGTRQRMKVRDLAERYVPGDEDLADELRAKLRLAIARTLGYGARPS